MLTVSRAMMKILSLISLPKALVRSQNPPSRAASIMETVVPKAAENVSGEWRYRMRGPGSKQVLGRLWLNANGPLVVGVLEVGERRDKLSGEIQQGAGVLNLIWIDSSSKPRHIRLSP